MVTLTDREKKLLKLFIIFIVGLLSYLLIISPIIDYKTTLESEYKTKLEKLNSIDNLYEKYINLKREKTVYLNLLKNNEGVTSLIEIYAKETNILKNKVYTKEHPSTIQNKYKKISTEVKFEGVDISSVVKFIFKLENSNKIIRVAFLRIRLALKGKDTYDVTIKIDTFSVI